MEKQFENLLLEQANGNFYDSVWKYKAPTCKEFICWAAAHINEVNNGQR